MRLGALIDDLDAAVGDIDVAGIATDSREVCPGEVFFALSALLVLDFFVYAIVPAPASAVQATPKCP